MKRLGTHKNMDIYKTWVQHGRSVKFNEFLVMNFKKTWMYKPWVQHERRVNSNEFLGMNKKNMDV
jgi:hypothetical protein